MTDLGSSKPVAATIQELKAREETRRQASQEGYWAKVNRSEPEIPRSKDEAENTLETLSGLKSFIPRENLNSYLNFLSYLGKREEEDIFVRLIHFLAIHTKLGQQLPQEIHKAGEHVVQNIRHELAHDIGSWKEEHDSLNRIKHEFQGSIASMLKEHRDAHQKHLTIFNGCGHKDCHPAGKKSAYFLQQTTIHISS